MSPFLRDYAVLINSQFGEDGIIEECFSRLDLTYGGVCIDVGASDGRECSNTIYLRDRYNWRRILIEADEVLFGRMEEHELDTQVSAEVTSTGPCSLDELVKEQVAFLSLDIDGDDYGVLQALQMRPSLICAEFNQTIPWQYEIKSPQIGCSLSALCHLMVTKDYTFIGATECNAFFVQDSDKELFSDLNLDPSLHLSTDNFTYLVTAPFGGAVAVGRQIFGVQKRFVGELDVVDSNGEVHHVQLSHRSARPN